MKQTALVFVAFLVAFFGYDLWTLNARGYETTASWLIYSHSADWPAIPFVFGFFMGHLFFSVRQVHKAKKELK